jgi:hypothetical protein
MINLLKIRTVRIIGLAGICILLIIIYSYAQTIIFENEQAKIKLSPMQAVEALKAAGYQVENLREDNEYLGTFGEPIYGLRFTLVSDTTTYSMFLVQYDDWKQAQIHAKVINDLDDRMGHTNYNAVYYGNILISIFPSSASLGKRILDILKEIQ